MKKNPLRRADIILEDVPVPGCGAAQVLIANRASLISVGTEMASVQRNIKDMVVKALTDPDLRDSVKEMVFKDGLRKTADRVHFETTKWTPMGYSGCGIALEVGSQVAGIRQGDLVAYGGEGHAEVVRASKNLCVRVPDGVSAREAAFVALGSIALQAVRRAEVQVGDTVAVLGLGLVGQLMCQMLLAAGARVLGVDVVAERLALAQAQGVEKTFQASNALPQEILNYTEGVGVDRVAICASSTDNQIIGQAVSMARERGRIVVVGAVGMEVPREEFYHKELDLVISRSYGPGRYDKQYEEQGIDYPIGFVRWTEQRNMAEFLRLVQIKKVDVQPLITHEFSLDAAANAYEVLSQRGAGSLAVLLKYDERLDYGQRQVVLREPPRSITAVHAPARVAVVGCGAFARQFHLPNLRSQVGLALGVVVASSGQTAKEMAARYGADTASTDYHQALADPSLNAVMILTRDATHASMATAALAAGKHVFCEKPLATTIEECRAVAEAARASERVCMTGFNRRFAPLILQARHALADCAGPRLIHYRVNAGPLPADHWVFDLRHSAGRIVGEACHFVDLFRFLIGAEPISVSAQVLDDYPSDVRLQNVAAMFRFSDGSLANLIYTSVGDTRAGKERLEIFCDGQVITLDDYRTLTIRGKRRLDARDRAGDKGHQAELAHFARAILGQEPPQIDWWDGVAATICCRKLIESARLGEILPIDLHTELKVDTPRH